MTRYKLIYFDFDGGRGEPVRIGFKSAGIDFEDERLSFAEFGERRDGFRFRCVPVLEIDGEAVTQSNAHCRYVGKQAGLYPEDDIQALYCDEAMGAVEDLTNHIVRTFGLEGSELEEARKNLVDGWLSVYLRGLGELLARGGGDYFADHRLTIADLKVFLVTRWLRSGALDHVPSDLVERLAPPLVDHEQRVMADERVAGYYAGRG